MMEFLGLFTLVFGMCKAVVKAFMLSIRKNTEMFFDKNGVSDRQHIVDVATEIVRLETLIVQTEDSATKMRLMAEARKAKDYFVSLDVNLEDFGIAPEQSPIDGQNLK